VYPSQCTGKGKVMTYLTRDDFIRIACEAGIDKYLNINGHLIGNLLERFGQKIVHESGGYEKQNVCGDPHCEVCV
jgi:dephospho-CoA kinase